MNGASIKTTAFHLLVLALFAIIAYWPLSTLQHATRWDSVDGYFPSRYFISDCLRHGQLPLWLPYQLGGSPFYADPQSGAWYPLAWIICFAAPYTLKSLAVEYLLSFFLSGAGMYQLIKSFGLKPAVALIAGISYTACGFFVSNAEHLTWVISAAWIPWVFWAYHRMIETKAWGYVFPGGLFLFLLLSGGYPAFITVTIYLIILFFLIQMLKKQPVKTRRKLLWLHLSLAGVFLILSLGLLISWLQFIPLMSRGEGMTLVQVMVHPFSPRCFESFLLPFTTLKGAVLFNTDISMRNAYVGLLSLTMLPFGLLQTGKNSKLLVVAIASLLCLMAALGTHLPIRAFLYNFVPGMDLFRFPSLFRVFSIVGLIVIAAHGLNEFLDKKDNQQKWLRLTPGLLLIICILAFFRSVYHHGFSWHWGFSTHSFLSNLPNASLDEHVQLQALIQSLLLGTLIFLWRFSRGKWLRIGTLIAFCFVDMAVATGLNNYGTVVTMEPMTEQEKPIVNSPRDFPVPDNRFPVAAYLDRDRDMGLLWKNTSIYHKTIAPDGYNTFALITLNRLDSSAICKQVWTNPYLYFAHGIEMGDDTDSLKNSRNIRLEPNDYEALKQRPFATDTKSKIIVKEYLPNKIVAEINAEQASVINLQQSYAKGWTLLVDEKKTPIFVSNYTQMASLIPAGRHDLVWRFNPPYIRSLISFTVLALISLLGFLLIFRKSLFRN